MAVLDLVEIFWDAAPYVVVAIAVVGTWWRYRYDKFGWTTRSSQLYESRLLSIGSPMFHFGSLLVIMGHVMGLFIPDSWTRAFGMSDLTCTICRRCCLARPPVSPLCSVSGC